MKAHELGDHPRYAGHPGGSEFTHAWVHDAAVMGGGTLMDNGIHLIDLTRYFLGGVAEVSGTSSGDVWQFPGCEDNGFVLMRTPDGRVGHVQASWTEWQARGPWRVPHAWWATSVAVTWPFVAARELNYTLPPSLVIGDRDHRAAADVAGDLDGSTPGGARQRRDLPRRRGAGRVARAASS